MGQGDVEPPLGDSDVDYKVSPWARRVQGTASTLSEKSGGFHVPRCRCACSTALDFLSLP